MEALPADTATQLAGLMMELKSITPRALVLRGPPERVPALQPAWLASVLQAASCVLLASTRKRAALDVLRLSHVKHGRLDTSLLATRGRSVKPKAWLQPQAATPPCASHY